jgi:hypothetical protein
MWTQAWTGIKAEFPKTLMSVLISGLGFLIALLINGWMDNRKERETYRSMLTAVRSEAVSNSNTIETSYRQFFPEGVVIREFSTSTLTQMFSNPLFVKHANPKDIETLSVYLRDLTLANGYRRVSETIRIMKPAVDPSWLSGITEGTEQALTNISKDIERVMEIKE